MHMLLSHPNLHGLPRLPCNAGVAEPDMPGRHASTDAALQEARHKFAIVCEARVHKRRLLDATAVCLLNRRLDDHGLWKQRAAIGGDRPQANHEADGAEETSEDGPHVVARQGRWRGRWWKHRRHRRGRRRAGRGQRQCFLGDRGPIHDGLDSNGVLQEGLKCGRAAERVRQGGRDGGGRGGIVDDHVDGDDHACRHDRDHNVI
eukprot:2545513-Prymnesium_polylepis.1